MSSPRRILIVGTTPLALFLATQWHEAGHLVTVVDRKGADFSGFPETLSAACIEGEPLDRSVLRRARIEETDVMVGATMKDDLNLAVAIASHDAFHVGRAVAVVRDPRKADTFSSFGVKVVCPTSLAGASILRFVGGSAETTGTGIEGATRDRERGLS